LVPVSGGIALGRLLGIEIKLDWSLLLIFALITWNLGAQLFPSWHPDWSAQLSWATAAAAALLFLASILVHELCHALVARREGIPIRRITLFLFGGVAHMEAEPTTPKAEFWMAIVGPLASILIGIVASTAGVWLAGAFDTPFISDSDPEVLVRGAGPIATLLLWLGPLNVLLGVFNLVPGFPLDGGRVLRSILWAVTNDLTRATRWASRAGELFGWTLIAIGLMNAFAGQVVQGLWLVLIGWFVHQAARTSYRQLLVRRALKDVPVSRLMRAHVPRLAPELPVETLVREYLLADDVSAVAVASAGALLGVVFPRDVRNVPQERWRETPISSIMTPVREMTAVSPETPVSEVVEQLAQGDIEAMPVVEKGQVVGLISGRDVLKWIALQGVQLPRPIAAG
jgi:Zn-dependent protease/predicted transcriptional regulator